jgi:hypothetical protein
LWTPVNETLTKSQRFHMDEVRIPTQSGQ